MATTDTISKYLTSQGEYYALSNRWVVRYDGNLSYPYTAYSIDRGTKHEINEISFLVLKILESNCLTIECLSDYLRSKGLSLKNEETTNLIYGLIKAGLLVKSKNQPCIDSSRYSGIPLKHNVPVTQTPLEAEIHLTRRCNLPCLHCAYNAGQILQGEIDTDLWLKIFDELEFLNTYHIVISGGEPLLYPGAKDLLRHLTSKRMRIELLTNGTLMNNDIAVYLSSPNFSTTVSLDGADKEIHDLLRGSESFNNVIKGIKMLSEAKALFHLSTTLHKRNMHQMKEIVEKAIELGAVSISFLFLDPVGRAKHQRGLLLNSQDTKNILFTIQSLQKAYRNEITINYLDPSKPEYKDIKLERNSKVFCNAGTTRMAIRSDGIIFPCVYGFHDNKYAIGSTKTQSVQEIWQQDNWLLFRGGIELQQLHKCRDCSLLESCTLKICRLRSYYNTGDFFGVPSGCYRNEIS